MESTGECVADKSVHPGMMEFTSCKSNTAWTASLLANFGLELCFMYVSRFSWETLASSLTSSPKGGVSIAALRIYSGDLGGQHTVILKLIVANQGG